MASSRHISAQFRHVFAPAALLALALCGVALIPAAAAPIVQSEKADTVREGAGLFASSGCVSCHGPEGMGTGKGPSLRDERKRKDASQIAAQIHDGGQAMPPFGDALTGTQITALVQFLRVKDGWKLVAEAK